MMKMLKNFDFKKMWPYVVGAFLIVVAGVGGGWLINSKLLHRGVAAPGATVTSTSAGVLDPNVKYNNATGQLLEGGIGNEGTHHLDTGNGPGHFVYLTSSVIDLQSFVGKKVEVWGETLASKKAPWLMDVAKIQVVQ